MILMMMTALCCTVQVKADDQSYNLDTIRMEATLEPTETYQYLKPTYQKGVIVTSPWNECFYGHSIRMRRSVWQNAAISWFGYR